MLAVDSDLASTWAKPLQCKSPFASDIVSDCVALGSCHRHWCVVCVCHAGLVWWQRGQDYYGGVQAASDILGLLFFVLLFPSMRALFRALFTFPVSFRPTQGGVWSDLIE